MESLSSRCLPMSSKLSSVFILCSALSVLSPTAQGISSSTLTLTSTPNPSILGASVILSAAVTPANATGSVTFYDGVTVLGTRALAGGSASFMTSLLPTGSRKLRAYYLGDSNYGPASSNGVTQTVLANPSLALAQAPTHPQASTAIVVGDFNGDGIADLATVQQNALAILLGNGDGTFRVANPIPGLGQGIVGPQLLSVFPVAAADFNGDGKADLLVQDLNPNGNLYLLVGDGAGDFQTPVRIAPAATSTVVGDFNGDGRADLVLASANGINLLLGNGDGTFRAPALISGGSGVLAVGDFNGDGKADLAIGNGSTVSVWIGNGDGTFPTALADSAQTQATFILVADVNRDGVADLVTLSANNKVSVQLGNGNGTFQAPVSTFAAPSAASVAVGDVDGDGSPDLIIGYAPVGAGSNLEVRSGLGTGLFGMARTYLQSGGTAIVIGDFNSDGRADLLTTTNLLLGATRTLNAFALPESTLVGTAFPFPLTVVFADSGGHAIAGANITFTAVPSASGASAVLSSANAVTGPDGQASVTATANSIPGSYQVMATCQGLSALFPMTNLAAGTTLTLVSGTQQSAPLGAPFPQPLTVQVMAGGSPVSGISVSFSAVNANIVLSSGTALTDSSGMASVTATAGNIAGPYTVTASLGAQSVTFVLFNGSAATITLGASPNPSVLGAPVTLTATINPSNSSGRVTFYDGTTVLGTKAVSNGFAVLPTRLLSSGTHKLGAVYLSDGVHASSTSNVVTQTVNAQPANALIPGSLPAVSPLPVTSAVRGDFNNDGFPDIAVSFGNALGLYLATGSGTFRSLSINPQITGNLVGAADFNGDGNTDLLVDTGSSYLELLGNGDGTFQSAMVIGSPSQKAVGIGDFNGDGKPDLAINDPNGVKILLGKGDGTFQQPTLYPAGGLSNAFPLGLAIGDFNGDGIADLLVSNSTVAGVLLGRGDGTFRPPLDDSSIASTNIIAVADFNHDGKADLIAVVSPNVFFQRGNGDGTFQAPVQIFSTLTPFSLAVEDFNGDGNPDVAVLGVAGTVSVLLGNGDGTFGAPIAYPSLNDSLLAGDFNGDGKADLLMSGTLMLGATVTFTATGGTPQSTVAGTPFANALQATVRDSNGNPVSGAIVTFAAPVTPVGASAMLSVSRATTNVSGVATVTATANNTAGSYTVTATLGGLAAAFALTNTPGPGGVTATGGTPQFTPVGTAFGSALQATVSDSSGNPVVGVTVTFTEPTVGASAVLSSRTAVTNASGVAIVTATANSIAGSYTVTASVGTQSASFLLTNTPGAPASIMATGGAVQSALVGTAFPNALQATVKDSAGNPVPGVTVTFTIPTVGAGVILSSSTATTNPSGVASVTATANGVAGSYPVTAGVGSLTAVFSLTNTSTAPTTMTIMATGGTPQSALLSSMFPNALQVTITNSGAPAAGVTVTFTAPTMGPSAVLSSNTAVTNASGIASVTATANNLAGGYLVTATAGPLSTTFSLTNVQAGSSNLALGRLATQSSTYPGSPSAAVAVDGNTDGAFFDGSVTATNADPNAWWQVDLGASSVIASVTIWNRTDCCASRLSNYWVFISNTPFLNTDTPATLQNRAGTFASLQAAPPSPSTVIAVNAVQGRYVRVQLSGTDYLSLAEVQVTGSGGAPTAGNLSQGKPAAESSTYPGSPGAAVAVDGNLDGNYYDGSVTATNTESNAWWQVDLGASASVNSIAIYNRTDCCGSRLNDYWIFISDTPFLPTDTPATLQTRPATFASHQLTAPATFVTIPLSAQGRYVRIQLTGINILSLAEVQVFGQ